MSLKFGLSLPQGWTMELANMKDPVEAYETMTQVARYLALLTACVALPPFGADLGLFPVKFSSKSYLVECVIYNQ
jgi:hypothetical protein